MVIKKVAHSYIERPCQVLQCGNARGILISFDQTDRVRRNTRPLVIVGPDDPNHFILNQAAQNWLDELQLPDGSWQAVPTVIPAHS